LLSRSSPNTSDTNGDKTAKV